MEKNRGKGFLKSEEPTETLFDETLEYPKIMVVLTDVYMFYKEVLKCTNTNIEKFPWMIN